MHNSVAYRYYLGLMNYDELQVYIIHYKKKKIFMMNYFR